MNNLPFIFEQNVAIAAQGAPYRSQKVKADLTPAYFYSISLSLFILSIFLFLISNLSKYC